MTACRSRCTGRFFATTFFPFSELDHNGRPWRVREWGLWRDSAMTQPSAKQRIATDLLILMLGAVIMGAFWAL